MQWSTINPNQPWLPQKASNSGTLMSHHTRHSSQCGVCNLLELHSHENTKDNCMLQDPGPKLISALTEEASVSCQRRVILKQARKCKSMCCKRLLRCEEAQLIHWNSWGKRFILGSWLKLTFCSLTLAETMWKFHLCEILCLRFRLYQPQSALLLEFTTNTSSKGGLQL